LGRLAGAVLVGALITFTAAPAAFADETTSPATTTTSESSQTETTTTTTATSSTAAGDTETSSPTTTTSDSAGTTSTSVGTTESSKPTETSESSASSTPEEPPYQDDVAYGLDLGKGYGIFAIACAAGEPTGVSSPDFDIVEGPYQEEQDGRYWDYLVQLHGDTTFASGHVRADWKCGGTEPQGGNPSGGGVTVPPVAGSSGSGAWQSSNGGNAQVSFAPKSGVETGFGGTAQG
jgi:hypothetical protein